ncbi:AAA family ATPase [Flavobacterium sp.]|uniref:AAA family ATPase n=1 Tax=Flavobacterium sp. TaxID=239 RepID=UPI002FDA04F3
MDKVTLLQFIDKGISEINYQLEFAKVCEADADLMNLYLDSIIAFTDIRNNVEIEDLSQNYLNQFQSDILITLQNFEFRTENSTRGFRLEDKFLYKNTLDIRKKQIGDRLKILKFNLDFFQKLNYFNNNVVAIGANGSGKTTLSNNLKQYLPNNGVVISAQRILVIPTFSGISNILSTSEKLASTQSIDKTYKTTYSTENNGNSYTVLRNMGDEFKILLDNMLAERSVIRNKFCDDHSSGTRDAEVPITNLDTALKIWNFLIEHKTMECADGINITLTNKGTDSYPAYQMSDGEKVTLYLISQVLQAPKNGFVIVDEPEIYLHKTILNKLWDILEKERQDCIFIYLTHDLDFATTRTSAKKNLDKIIYIP